MPGGGRAAGQAGNPFSFLTTEYQLWLRLNHYLLLGSVDHSTQLKRRPWLLAPVSISALFLGEKILVQVSWEVKSF